MVWEVAANITEMQFAERGEDILGCEWLSVLTEGVMRVCKV